MLFQVTIEDLPHFTRQKEQPTGVLVDVSDDPTVPLVPVVLKENRKGQDDSGDDQTPAASEELVTSSDKTETEIVSELSEMMVEGEKPSEMTINVEIKKPDDDDDDDDGCDEIDHHSVDDEDLPPPPPIFLPDEYTEGQSEHSKSEPEDSRQEKVEKGSLVGLLRKKLETDLEELGSDEDIEDFIRGKYRFSHLDEDITDDFLTELSEISSTTGSVDTRGEETGADEASSEEDEEFFVKDNEDIEKEMTYVMGGPVIDQSVEERAPLASQETLTEDDKASNDLEQLSKIEVGLNEQKAASVTQIEETKTGADQEMDAEVGGTLNRSVGIAADLLGELEKNIDQIVPEPPKRYNKLLGSLTQAVGDDLDAVVPPPRPIRGQSSGKVSALKMAGETAIYENVPMTMSSGELNPNDPVEKTPPGIIDQQTASVVSRHVSLRKKSGQQPTEQRQSTLWDELTAKLKNIPKFDPDVEIPDENRRSISVQTSSEELGIRILTVKGDVTVATQTNIDETTELA